MSRNGTKLSKNARLHEKDHSSTNYQEKAPQVVLPRVLWFLVCIADTLHYIGCHVTFQATSVEGGAFHKDISRIIRHGDCYCRSLPRSISRESSDGKLYSIFTSNTRKSLTVPTLIWFLITGTLGEFLPDVLWLIWSWWTFGPIKDGKLRRAENK